MTTRLTVVNPIATPASHVEKGERHPPARRSATLDGATVALYWNGKQRGLDALARTKEKLAETYKDIVFLDVLGAKGGTMRYLSDEQIDMLVREVDAVVATTAD
jgi:hypothetical protein